MGDIATGRQLWRLNQLGWIELRKEPGAKLTAEQANRVLDLWSSLMAQMAASMAHALAEDSQALASLEQRPASNHSSIPPDSA